MNTLPKDNNDNNVTERKRWRLCCWQTRIFPCSNTIQIIIVSWRTCFFFCTRSLTVLWLTCRSDLHKFQDQIKIWFSDLDDWREERDEPRNGGNLLKHKFYRHHHHHHQIFPIIGDVFYYFIEKQFLFFCFSYLLLLLLLLLLYLVWGEKNHLIINGLIGILKERMKGREGDIGNGIVRVANQDKYENVAYF